eukprot:g30531.t1
MRGRRRAVICVETGEQFSSMASAGRSMGLRGGAQNILMALRMGTKAGGVHWTYAQESPCYNARSNPLTDEQQR